MTSETVKSEKGKEKRLKEKTAIFKNCETTMKDITDIIICVNGMPEGEER